jgi:hypothetical protein
MCAQRCRFIPGLDLNVLRGSARKRFLIEHGRRGRINQEALIGFVYPDDRNRQAVAALQRDFGFSGRGLRANGGRRETKYEGGTRENKSASLGSHYRLGRTVT